MPQLACTVANIMQGSTRICMSTCQPRGGRHFCMASGHNHESDVARRRRRIRRISVLHIMHKKLAAVASAASQLDVFHHDTERREQREGAAADRFAQNCQDSVAHSRTGWGEGGGGRWRHCPPGCSLNIVSNSQPLHIIFWINEVST